MRRLAAGPLALLVYTIARTPSTSKLSNLGVRTQNFRAFVIPTDVEGPLVARNHASLSRGAYEAGVADPSPGSWIDCE